MTQNTVESRQFRGLTLVGGHPALDLVNSVKYRGRSDPMDTLGSYIDVVDWAELVEIVDKNEADLLRDLVAENPATSNDIFSDICRFRENLRCVLEPGAHRNRPQEIAATELEGVIEALQPLALINIDTHTLTRSYPIRELVGLKHRLVQIAIELMEMFPVPQIGACAADDCDWLFIDRSKAKRRRWCDTKTCGNRARVRQFRAQDVRTKSKMGNGKL